MTTDTDNGTWWLKMTWNAEHDRGRRCALCGEPLTRRVWCLIDDDYDAHGIVVIRCGECNPYATVH